MARRQQKHRRLPAKRRKLKRRRQKNFGVRTAQLRKRLRHVPRNRRRRKARATLCPLLSRPFLIRHRSRSGERVDRLAVVAAVAGVPTAFYRSTGTGGRVKRGGWVPFGGISRRNGGWFIKVPGKVPTGDFAVCALRLSRRRMKPTKIFDQADYPSVVEHSADVNAEIAKYGALDSRPVRFQVVTVNVKRRTVRGVSKARSNKCGESGQVTASREAMRVYHCPCGANMYVTPKYNRRVAGEVVEGWSVKIPSHTRR